MRKNLKYLLIILAVIVIPALLVVFIASIGSYTNYFGPFQYLFSSDASATWDPLTNYTGDLVRQLWPANSLFVPTGGQAVVSIILIIIALILASRRHDSDIVRWGAMVLAMVTITRHLLWRILYTIDYNTTANAIAGIVVYAAEVSAFLAMILGYFQMFKPTQSRFIDISKFPIERLPSVDVFITTYNEGTDILYRGIVGALSLDYPKKKVYILDDGNRPEVRELCNHLGCNYITRTTNEHAKAGNMNNALKFTDGDLVAIFDADHVPTFNFLRETIGYFIEEPQVAFVQTPQHFFTPDPFQRNLLVERAVTNEQDLFYHVIQPGNNYWGSSFFAGSGAVFRRAHLERIHGFAIETITEDTHTGIRLHSLGYKSYYVNKVLAAGLAQDSFLDYLNQRIRWGKGMFQILRYDNPLFTPGLTLPQRLCYFSGIYYFFHGLPRIIFLIAPLAFLAGGLKPIDAGIFEMVIYYAPSFLITILTFSIITKGIRQTFWSEVYESATALFLFVTTTLAIVSPEKARFKVTRKGTISSEAIFEWTTILPQLIIASLTMVGIIFGLVRIIITPNYIGGILPNLFWATYNMVLMVGAIIVAANRPQYRSSPRIYRKVRCELSLVDGTYAVGHTTNISETGMALMLEKPIPVSEFVTIRITDTEIGVNTTLSAQVIRSVVDRNSHHYIGLRILNRTDQQHQNLIKHMFIAPSTWSDDFAYDRKSSGSFYKLFTTIMRWGTTEEIPFYRVAPRFDKTLDCIVIHNNETYKGLTSEISETGTSVKIKGPIQIKMGDKLTLRIQWQDSKINEYNCEVVRLIKTTKDTVLLGVRFLSTSLDQKISIITYLYDYSNEVVRVAPNFKRTLSCLLLNPETNKQHSGYTYEISETSAAIGLDDVSFKVGDNVKLILQWEDRTREEFKCKINHIYPSNEHYLVKLTFIEMTPQIRKELIKRLYTRLEETRLYSP